jgi:peptidoglycan/LPS O-acetylase OafA/YrhL
MLSSHIIIILLLLLYVHVCLYLFMLLIKYCYSYTKTTCTSPIAYILLGRVKSLGGGGWRTIFVWQYRQPPFSRKTWTLPATLLWGTCILSPVCCAGDEPRILTTHWYWLHVLLCVQFAIGSNGSLKTEKLHTPRQGESFISRECNTVASPFLSACKSSFVKKLSRVSCLLTLFVV